jgi:hypothetical protein
LITPYLFVEIEKSEMGKICSTEKQKFVQCCGGVNLNEREHLEDVGVDGKIKLKIKYTWRACTLLMYSKMRTIKRL